MKISQGNSSVLQKLGLLAALGGLFLGTQFALAIARAGTTSITCSTPELDWQGGPAAWSQRMASRASKHLVETFGSLSSVDVKSTLQKMPQGC